MRPEHMSILSFLGRCLRLLLLVALAVLTSGSGGCESEDVCSPSPELRRGEECSADCECSNNLYCGCAPGDSCSYDDQRCQAPRTRDQDCRRDSMCADGLFCHRLENTCQPPAARGEPCDGKDRYATQCEGDLVCNGYMYPGRCLSPGEPGDRCGARSDCESDLICSEFAPRCKRCEPRRGPGEECSGNGECDEGLRCVEVGDTPRCREPGQQGETCASGFDCAGDLNCNTGYDPPQCQPGGYLDETCGKPNDCTHGLNCNTGYEPPQCQTDAAENEPCGEDDDCGSDLICNTALAVCTTPGGDGKPCTRHKECADEFKCALDGDQAHCKPIGHPQQLCRTASSCPEGMICSPGPLSTCQLPREVGEPCVENRHCDDDLRCIEGSCMVSVASGEACSHDDQCKRREICSALEGKCMFPNAEGEPCAADRDCGRQTLCNDAFDPPQCQEPAEAGEACTEDRHCISPMKCHRGSCHPDACEY